MPKFIVQAFLVVEADDSEWAAERVRLMVRNSGYEDMRVTKVSAAPEKVVQDALRSMMGDR